MALAGDKVYAIASTGGAGNAAADVYRLLTLDAATLKETARRDLSFVHGPVASLVAYKGKLYFPLTADDDGTSTSPRRDLVVLDPATTAVEKVDLTADLPYRLRLVGDKLVIAHTFINPVFGDLSTLRHVSVVDLRTMAVKGYDLKAGILDIQVTDQNLLLLGILNEDFSRPLVETYALSDMTRSASTVLTRPGDDYFPAALFAP